MPRYFFDIDDGVKSLPADDEGCNCSDDEAARQELLASLGIVVREALPDGNMRDFLGNVRNESGVIVFEAVISLRSRWVAS